MVQEIDIKKNFGNVVKELRTNKNITQEKLAEYLGLQTRSITAIECGKTFVSCEVLEKLSNFFEVDLSIFFIKRVNIHYNGNVDYLNETKKLLHSFPQNKLKKLYNMLLLALNK